MAGSYPALRVTHWSRVCHGVAHIRLLPDCSVYGADLLGRSWLSGETCHWRRMSPCDWVTALPDLAYFAISIAPAAGDGPIFAFNHRRAGSDPAVPLQLRAKRARRLPAVHTCPPTGVTAPIAPSTRRVRGQTSQRRGAWSHEMRDWSARSLVPLRYSR